MKPAWHEVVASLETSLARGSHGSHASNGSNGTNGNSRLSTGAVVIPRGLPMTWHEPMADRPAAAPAIAAPSGRAELLASLERRMNREDEGIAVALVDLDGFKALNQDHGYAAGDQVLAATLVRLQGAVGSGLVARFGSDEFAVLLGGVEMPAPRLAIADRLVAAVSEPTSLGGASVRLGASVGIACRTASHARPEDLIRDADRALSRARTLGGNRSAIHDPATSGRPLALAELEVALRRALDTDEFREHYQPIVSVKGGQVAGFEVHLWRRSAAGRRR